MTSEQPLVTIKIKMVRNIAITLEKKREIIIALERDLHASRVARTLGDVSYATVWRVADRRDIELKAGRAAKGYKRLPPEIWTQVEREVAAHPEATQKTSLRAKSA